MNDDSDEKKKRIKPEEADLWRRMTGDVEPMPNKQDNPKEHDDEQESFSALLQADDKPSLQSPSQNAAESPQGKNPSGSEIDHRTFERLRRGQIQMEGRLDLHGFRQHEAKDKLEAFILSAHASGKRCVLVITGKGSRQGDDANWMDGPKGILKQKVPQWLTEPPLGGIVLNSCIAQPRHGGAGALYVYLRRRR